MSANAHASLIAGSPGYRRFLEAYSDEDAELLAGFADWLTAGSYVLDEFLQWTSEQFAAQWNHWNS